MIKVSQGEIWRHRKSGGVYRVIRTGVFMQCSTAEAFENQFAGQGWVVYTRNGDLYPSTAKWFIRLESEFLDGRFEKLDVLP